MGEHIDLDRIFLLLSVTEKALSHGAQYRWIADAAMAELNKMHPDNQEVPNGTEDTE